MELELLSRNLKRQKNLSLFTDVFSKKEHSQDAHLDGSAPFMEEIVLSKERVTKVLKGTFKALGPDES